MYTDKLVSKIVELGLTHRCRILVSKIVELGLTHRCRILNTTQVNSFYSQSDNNTYTTHTTGYVRRSYMSYMVKAVKPKRVYNALNTKKTLLITEIERLEFLYNYLKKKYK